MPDLLLELFSEEIPARMQGKAAKDLQRLVTDGLVENGLTYAGAASFATPRRLALAIGGLTDGSKSTKEERKGPKVGAPDKAVEGFLRGVGLTKDQLDVRTVGNAEVYFATIEKPGRAAEDIIGEVVLKTIQSFPWPKSMRWGTAPLRWVRPLRNILCVLTREDGSSVIPVDLPGFISNDKTYGHRFMGPNEVSVSSFEDYSAKLKHQFVILDPQERADTIWQDATNQAFAQG